MDKDGDPHQSPDPGVQSQPHSPKTLTLETPDHGLQKPQVEIEYTQIDEDDDRQLPTPKSPRGFRRGHKGKKPGPKWLRGKVFQQKFEAFHKTFKPLPFAPAKALDFAGHKGLLRRLGLWEFVHVSLDGPLRSDLIEQLVATYRKKERGSVVSGRKVLVNRTHLARALKMPVPGPGRKKDRASLGIEVLPEKPEDRGSIAFLSDLLSNWVLIHDDTWIMPDNVMSWFTAIQEGRFDCLDWPEMMWFMVEKELMQGTDLRNCYYASHLQCLIRSQKEDLFREEADVKDEDDDVKTVELEDQSLELSLGHETVDSAGVDEKESAAVAEAGAEKEESFCSEKTGGEEGNAKTGVGKEVEEAENQTEDDNVVKEQGGVVADVMDSEDKQEEEEHQGGQWFLDGQNETGRQFLQQCSFNSIGDFSMGFDIDTDKKAEEEEREDGQEMQGREVEEEEMDDVDDDDDNDEEEREDEQGGFHMPGNLNYLDGLASANLIQLMDNGQMPFSSGAQIHDDSCGEFLASGSRPGTHHGPGVPPAYMNPNKREMDHNNGLLLNGGPSKRMRTEQLDFNTCSENMMSWFEKMRMAHEEKEQSVAEMTMSQQMLINEMEQRGAMIEHLQKVKSEEQQKLHHNIYKLERELYMMTGLAEGYRKALKETNRAFADYRARCPQLDEPLYRDVPGSGGLVLSVTELEKQRLKREEEEKMKFLIITDRIKEFEATWKQRFEARLEGAELLSNRLLMLEDQMKDLKELAAKRKVVQEKVEEPVIEEKAEEPVIEEKFEEPVIEEKTEEPVVQEKVEEPVIEEKTEEPVIEEKAEESVIEEKAEEPVIQEKAEEPAGQEKAEESADQEAAKESDDQVMGEVSTQIETEA